MYIVSLAINGTTCAPFLVKGRQDVLDIVAVIDEEQNPDWMATQYIFEITGKAGIRKYPDAYLVEEKAEDAISEELRSLPAGAGDLIDRLTRLRTLVSKHQPVPDGDDEELLPTTSDDEE